MYASLGASRDALHLDLFEQPAKERVSQHPASIVLVATLAPWRFKGPRELRPLNGYPVRRRFPWGNASWPSPSVSACAAGPPARHGQFGDLRADLAARFFAIDKPIDDLRAELNQRLNDMNQSFGNRLNDMNQKLTTFMWIVSAWFTFLTAVLAVFGFLRR